MVRTLEQLEIGLTVHGVGGRGPMDPMDRREFPLPAWDAQHADLLAAKLQKLSGSSPRPSGSDVSSEENDALAQAMRARNDSARVFWQDPGTSATMISLDGIGPPYGATAYCGGLDAISDALSCPDVLESISKHMEGTDLPAWSLTCKRFREGVVAARRGREKIAVGGMVATLSRAKWALAQDFLHADRVCEVACGEGKVDVLTWALLRGFPAKWKCWRAAAQRGSGKVLKALESNGVPWETEEELEEIREEVEDIVREHDPTEAQRQVPALLGTCATAACNGHVKALQLLRSMGCPWDWTSLGMGCLFGHLEVVRWSSREGCDWSMWLSELVGRSGSIDCLEYMVDYGAAPLTEDTCCGAASGGHLEALEWLREVGCPWDHYTCQTAAKAGHLRVLQYALERGCPLDPLNAAGPRGAAVAAKAAEGGHRRVLEWLVHNGCQLDPATCRGAARSGDLQLLQWAREKGAPWDGMAYDGAAEGGHIIMLNVLRQMGCPWDFETGMRVLGVAARSGHVDCLEWAASQGADPSHASEELTLSAAMAGDGGAALRWCRGRRAPFHRDVCLELALRGDLPTLQFARAEGAGWGDGAGCLARAARARGHERLAVWAERNGCPKPEAAGSRRPAPVGSNESR